MKRSKPIYMTSQRTPHHSIGKAIKHYREKNRLTQTQLAKKIGACQGSISLYESDRATPSVKVIQRLCRELGVPSQMLIEQRWTVLAQ